MQGSGRPARLVLAAVVGACCLVAGVGLLGVTAWQALHLAPATPSAGGPVDDVVPSVSPTAPTPTAPTPTTPTPTTSASASATVTTSADRALVGRVVVLDPGHDRAEGPAARTALARRVGPAGAQVPCGSVQVYATDGYPESTVTWRVATSARARLEALGATVVLTRPGEAGVGPCADARAAVALAEHSDLLLALHAHGPLDVVVGAGDPSTALATAVRDALRDAGLGTASSPAAGADGKAAQTAAVAALGLVPVPAVLVDLGDVAGADAARLTSGAGQEQLAAALTRAVVADLRR